MSVVLLVGAELLLRTLFKLTQVDLGFQPSRTLTMGLFLGVRPPETRISTLARILIASTWCVALPGYLYGITRLDQRTYVTATMVTSAAALFAVAVVARRAARVHTAGVLRSS